MSTRKDRLNDIYAYLRKEQGIHTKKDLAEKIGQTLPALYSAFGGNTEYLTDNLFKRIAHAFPMLNVDWMLTGDGTMLKVVSKESTSEPIDHSSLVNAVIAAKDETIASLRDQIAQLNELIKAKDDIIAALRHSYLPADQYPQAAENK